MEHVIISQLRAVEAGIEVFAALVTDLPADHPMAAYAPLVAPPMRANLLAAIALLEAWGNGPTVAAEPAAEVNDGICRHPGDRRKSIATNGLPDAWMCQACDFIYEGEPR